MMNNLEAPNIESPNDDKATIHKYILDPLSVIIKLAILSKKRIGTKISVYNNIVYIQEIGVFQALVRYVFKNNKVWEIKADAANPKTDKEM